MRSEKTAVARGKSAVLYGTRIGYALPSDCLIALRSQIAALPLPPARGSNLFSYRLSKRQCPGGFSKRESPTAISSSGGCKSRHSSLRPQRRRAFLQLGGVGAIRTGDRPETSAFEHKNGAVASAVLVHQTRGTGPLRLALAGATRSGSAGVGSLLSRSVDKATLHPRRVNWTTSLNLKSCGARQAFARRSAGALRWLENSDWRESDVWALGDHLH